MEGEDYQNLAGICGSDAALESCLRQGGTFAAPASVGPGLFRNTAYWLRLQKDGDAYTGAWSADGETFTELFTSEATGIDAEYLILDAYQAGEAWETWQITLKSLNFRSVYLPAETVWAKADSIETGETYVIVADGAWAMSNSTVPAKENYSGSSTTLGAVPVVIEDGILRTAVTDNLRWTFLDSQGFEAYDGVETWFLSDVNGRLLRRTSMQNGNAGLVLDDSVNQSIKRYYAWSFQPYGGTEADRAMYGNSERAYGYDYPGRVGANEDGFDIPGGLSQRSASDPFAFMNDAACARITLCRQTLAPDLLPLMNAIHEAKALDPGKYTQESAAALANAVAAAEAALSTVRSQDEVSAAVQALNEALSTLSFRQAFRFADVQDAEAYYFEAVCWAHEADPQITSGVTPDRFGPDQVCTCGQVVTFLWRAAGSPEPMTLETGFTDVPTDRYYSRAVAWALETEITNGAAADRFKPEAPCTRGQIVTFLWRYAGSPAPQSAETVFTDVAPRAYYAEAAAWALEKGITTGTSPTEFSPAGACTRAQTVTFLHHLETVSSNLG